MQPTGLVQNAMAFIGLPLAFFATCSGLGLLVERAARASLPNQLLAPVGFCAAVSLMFTVFSLGATGDVAAITLVAASMAGFATARGAPRRAVALGWCGAAALAVYGVYVLPMAATGGWTWFGYNFLNDTSVQFGLIKHLKHFGTGTRGLGLSTGGQTLRTYVSTGYPLGAHSFAAALSQLLGEPIEVVYQSFLAAMAAVAAMGFSVVARAGVGARVAASLGAAAMASNLTFQYALQGSIKELGVLAALSAAAGVITVLVRAAAPVGLAALLGLCLAGVLSIYSAAGIPYVATAWATAAGLAVVIRGRSVLRRQWIAAAGLSVGVGAVAAAATLVTLRDFYNVASKVVAVGSPTGSALGQLGHRLGLLQASGVWLKGRYFEPIEPNTLPKTLTTVAAWLIGGLVLCAVPALLRSRRLEAAAAIVPLGLTAALVAPRVSPYADAKLLAILSPAIVLTAGIGLVSVWRRARPIAAVLGAALFAAVGVSDGLAYHVDKPAPVARMIAIEDAEAHTPGRGLILFNEFEEFAKYFDPAGRLNVATESITPSPVDLLSPQDRFGRAFDLDQEKLAYVQSFANIIARRSPESSRPPSDFRLVYTNRFYDVWSRDAGRPSALLHLPFGNNVNSASGVASCATVARFVRAARSAGVPTELVAALAPQTVLFDVPAARNLSPGWPPNGATPGTLTIAGPGQGQGPISIARAGRFAVWLRGDLPREIRVQVNGRDVGAASGLNTPGQWLAAGVVDLAAGRPVVRVHARGGTLRPGDGALGLLGPVAFVREEPSRLLRVRLRDATALCGKQLDWIEVVPRAVS